MMMPLCFENNLATKTIVVWMVLAIWQKTQANYYNPYGNNYYPTEDQYSVVAIPFSNYEAQQSYYNPPPQRSSYYHVEPWNSIQFGQTAPDSPSLGASSMWLDPMSMPGDQTGPTYVVEPMQQQRQVQVVPAPPPIMVQPQYQPPPPPQPPQPAMNRMAQMPRALPPAPLPSFDPRNIQLVAAPSPLTAQCPNGYTCCGDVKHYDPHNSLNCCGTMAYIASKQYCTNDNKPQYNESPRSYSPPTSFSNNYFNPFAQSSGGILYQPPPSPVSYVYTAPPQVIYAPAPPQYTYEYIPPPAPAPYRPYYSPSQNWFDSVRVVQPPAPLTPPCPLGYTCCRGVKHYDPHHGMACCGGQVYMPSAQFCAEGSVVDLVPASPPAAPAPPPVYVQKVTLVCEGIRWEVPYPNYQCCGPSVYNVAKETCTSDGLIEARTAPPPTTSTTTEVPTRLLVCQGHRFLIPAYDFQFYACCSNDPYFWPRESCLNGAVSPARPSTTTTSATPQEVQVLLVCDGIQHWIPSTERLFFGCCGQDLYDLRTDICRPPIAPSNSNTSSNTNCPSGYICCEDYPPVLNTNATLKCCPGIGPYDPATSVCPTNDAAGKRKRRR